ncbi:MAG: DUF1015 family protein [Melioribacteraceae bacterium]|nr:DUF1015 family protein [Melioribacteraceae bacterium]MCF8264181.1 DUF1015 family protein [Melioribacteraceae bacterium]MCF8430505.1 DUF1015 family protein [Melioribacteraceae bacterium]
MAIIKAFKAVRPAQEVAEKVASVPYDVVNRNEAAELASNNPINFLRVTRSEIELDKNTDPYNESVYLKAKENFQKLIDDGHLVQDEEAKFYIYRLIMGEQTQFGIAATFSVNDYDNNIIKKHEKTRKVKEDDRTNHIVTTEAQTGAVFLTYKGVDDINLIVEKTVNDNEPLYDFTTHDGVQHTIWAIPTDFNDIITFEIGKVENLYIADGHHRAASASRAQKVKRETVVNQTGAEEYNFFMAVLFPAEQLKILPYNRIVFSLNDLSESEFIENLKENFNLAETGIDSPKNKKEISMYFQKSWYTLTPNENVKAGEKIGDNLDVSILQNYLLNPVLGIEDPRTSNNVDFIGGIRGTKELEKRVDSGEAKVAFSLYPVSIDDLIAISDADEIMPPKSTWFEPKLRDGLLVHKI